MADEVVLAASERLQFLSTRASAEGVLSVQKARWWLSLEQVIQDTKWKPLCLRSHISHALPGFAGLTGQP